MSNQSLSLPLTPYPVDVYTRLMATNPSVQIYRQPAKRRTTLRGFRLFIDQDDFLVQEVGELKSELIRILLDEYIQGRVPAAKLKLLRKKGGL